MGRLNILILMAAIFSFSSCSSNNPKVGLCYSEPENALYISNLSSMPNMYRICRIEMDKVDSTLIINKISKRIVLGRFGSIKKVAYNNIKLNLPPEVKFIEYRGKKRSINELPTPPQSGLGDFHYLLQLTATSRDLPGVLR